MKSLFLFFILVLAFVPLCDAQVVKTFQWDKSADDTRDPLAANPVRYRMYECTDQAVSTCVNFDVGTALEKQLDLKQGIRYYVVRAYWNALSVDGKPLADILESGNSNILKVELKVPPGNPGNYRLRVTSVQNSEDTWTDLRWAD